AEGGIRDFQVTGVQTCALPIYVQEMELLREAGFSSLEVLHAATGVGAKILGHEDRAGNVRVGRKADLVLVRGNPVANLKLLYGKIGRASCRERGEGRASSESAG